MPGEKSRKVERRPGVDGRARASQGQDWFRTGPAARSHYLGPGCPDARQLQAAEDLRVLDRFPEARIVRIPPLQQGGQALLLEDRAGGESESADLAHRGVIVGVGLPTVYNAVGPVEEVSCRG